MRYGLQPGGAYPQRGLADRGRHRLDRGPRSDDNGGQRHQRQHDTAHQRRRARQFEEIDKYRQAQQAKNDGGHRRKIVDVDFDQVGQAVSRGELLEIHRRGHADGKRNGEGDQKGEKGAVQGHPNTRHLRLAGITLGKKRGVEARLGSALRAQLVQPGNLHILHFPVGFGQIRGDLALEVTARFRVGPQPYLTGVADQARIFQHHIP